MAAAMEVWAQPQPEEAVVGLYLVPLAAVVAVVGQEVNGVHIQ
tara:strand:- start:598 stop:726 length:129 start_codon:yes stop_codon:yes gene_type:complete